MAPELAGSMTWTLAALAITSNASGQEVFAPLVPRQSEQAAANFFSTNGATAESILSAAAPDPNSQHPLKWGPFVAHPRINYQFMRASGVRQGTNTYTTLQHLINPGLGLQMGRQWHLDGGVSYGNYSQRALSDTFGYNVGVNGAVPHGDWTFGVGAGASASEVSQTETAIQTKQQNYNLGLTGVYRGYGRTTLELGLNQNIGLSSGFNDSYGWSTMNWLNYAVTPKTSVGFGLGAGFTKIDAGTLTLTNYAIRVPIDDPSANVYRSDLGTDSVNEQVQGRLVWNPLPKLSFSFAGGVQIQQFLLDQGARSTANPIFSISSGWSPVEGTSFSLTGSRTIGNSIASDEYTTATSLAFGFSQRLLRRLTLGITPTLDMTEYQSSSDPGAAPSRKDDVFSVNVSLSTVLLRKVSVSAFFRYMDNSSDLAAYGYESRQVGFQLGYQF